MNRVLLQIKVSSSEMGKSEKKIADWILTHPNDIFPLSICELAELSGSSEATIVRFSRRLGFAGYQDLKIAIAQESKPLVVNDKIAKTDTCYQVFEKACNDIYVALEKTKKSLSPDSISAAAAVLARSKKIVIIGLGNSASIALDASHKLLRAGCDAFAYSDNHMQIIAASQTGVGDVLLSISHSGSSRDIVEAAKLAHEKGATTISITSKGKSPLAKTSDLVLVTDSDETKFSELALSSRIAQLAIIDTLYFYIVYQKDETLEAIKKTESALRIKKY